MSKKKNYKVNPQVEVADEKFEASEMHQRESL